jgi:CheY-like chemotaxis protein
MPQPILIVDDSRIDRLLAEECLRRAGYGVETAVSGSEALARMAKEHFALVVTDLVMPGESGLDVVRQLAAERPGLPVVLMTNHGSEDIAVQALRAGAADYVSKSHLVSQLPAIVDRLFDAAQAAGDVRRASRWIVSQKTEYELGNDRGEVGSLVRHLVQLARQAGAVQERDEIRVSVALEEALLNAIIHGNLEVSSELREGDPADFERLVAMRQGDPCYADRRVRVECEARCGEARYVIEDEGPGFDVEALPDPRDPGRLELASGRGVLLMRTFMDEVTYNNAGNCVSLLKRNASAPARNVGLLSEQCWIEEPAAPTHEALLASAGE